MTADKFGVGREGLTPESGFALVGIDYLSDSRGQLYLIEHFEMYQDALKGKNPDEYLVLYRGTDGEFCYR